MKWIVVMHNFLYTFLFVLHRKAGVSAYLYNEITVSKGLKMQSGEYGWLDYVNHFSADWQEEYARYCEEKGLAVGNESAAEFVRFKDEQLEAAMESGDA